MLRRSVPSLVRRLTLATILCLAFLGALSEARAQATFGDLQVSGANLPTTATPFKLLQQIPWGFTIQNRSDQAYTNPGGNMFLAYVTGRDVYGNQIYIEVARGDIPDIDNGAAVNIDNRSWTIPNDGTLYNMEAPGYKFVVSIFPVTPTTLAEVTTTEANPFLSRSGNFLLDVIPDLAVAAPGVTYLPRDYRGGDVINFTTTWGNRSVGERPLSSRPLRAARDRYSVSLHLSENAAFYAPPSPSPSPSPTPSPTGDADDAPTATDTVNDDFKLMGIIFGGDLATVDPDGSNQFRRVQVVNTPGPVEPYGLRDGAAAFIIGTQRNYTPQPDDGFLDIGEGVILTSEQLVPRNFEGDYFAAMRLVTASDARTGNNVFVSNAANKISIDATSDPSLEPASAVSTQTGTFVQAGNAGSSDGGISEEGTVVFASTASNLLVPPTQAGTTVPAQFATSGSQIFLKLRDTREVFLASRTLAGVQANADCFDPFISAGGRFVAFHSKASNLVAENTGARSMIYVYDTTTRQTVVVSRNALGALANGDSFNASLSASGRFVTFESVASNLDAPIVQPIITSGQIRSYAVLHGGSGYQPFTTFDVTLSGGTGTGARARATVGEDGSVVAVSPRNNTSYGSGYLASNPPVVIVPPPPQIYPSLAGQGQVYLHDRNVDGRVDINGNPVFDAAGNTRTYLVSVGLNVFDELATISDNLSYQPVVNANDSADDIDINGGMFVAFSSYASNMDGASGGRAMVYRALVDVANATGVVAMQPVSVNNAGAAGVVATAPGAVPFNLQPSISGDGSQVAFTSWSANLVYNPDSGSYNADTNGVQDVFVRNFRIPANNDLNRATVRVSVSEEKVATGTIFFTARVPLPLPPTGNNIPDSQPAAGDTITISTGAVSHNFIFDGASGPGQTAVTIGASVFETRDNLLTAIALSPLRSGDPRIEAVATTPPNAALPGTAYSAGIYLKNSARGEGGNVAILVNGVPIDFTVGGGANANIFGSGMSGGGTQAEDNPRAVQGVPFGSNQPSIDRSGRYVAFRTIAGNLDVYVIASPDVFTDPADPITGELIRPLLTPGSAASNVYIHDRNAQDIRDVNDLPVFDLPFDPVDQDEFISTRRVSVNRFGYPTYVTGTQEGGVNANSSANSSRPYLSPSGRYIVFTSTAPGEGGLIFGPNNLTPLDNASLPDIFVADLGTLGDAPPQVDSRPSVTILSPPDGLVVSPQTTIPVYANALARGDKTIVSAELFVNNASQGVLTAEPFAWSYVIPSNGTFVFRVLVTDSKGLTRDTSVRVVSEPPVAGAPLVEITQPVGAQNFVAGSSFFINGRVTATSPAEIDPTSVSFTVNGAPVLGETGRLGNEYGTLYTASLPNTVANLRVSARDTLGRSGFSAPISSRIGTIQSALPWIGIRPVVQASGVIAGGTVRLEAEAQFFGSASTSTNGTTQPNLVEFYVNNVFVGRGTPGAGIPGGRTLYAFDWTIPPVITSTPGPAVYSLRARAVEPNGSAATNAPALYGSVVSAATPLIVNYVPINPPLGSNAAFVIDYFRKIFMREPNFDEYDYYLRLLNAGETRAEVIVEMAESEEFAENQQVLFGYYARMGLRPTSQTNPDDPTSVFNLLRLMTNGTNTTLLPSAMSAGVQTNLPGLAPSPYGATVGQALVAERLIGTITKAWTNGTIPKNLDDASFMNWMRRSFNQPYLPQSMSNGVEVVGLGDDGILLNTIAGYPAYGSTNSSSVSKLARFGASYAFLSGLYDSMPLNYVADSTNNNLQATLSNFPALIQGAAVSYLLSPTGTWPTNAAGGINTNAVLSTNLVASNLPPQITSTNRVTATVGVAYPNFYQITATGVGASPGFAASGLPSGVSNVNTGTGVISGTPTAEGVFNAVVSATNAAGIGQLAVTMNILPAAPQIAASTLLATNQIGITPFKIPVTPTNTATRFGLSTNLLPPGLSFSATNGTIFGTPTIATNTMTGPQTNRLTMFATNAAGQATNLLTLIVYPELTTLGRYLATYSVAGSSARATADPDNDGFNNAVEFAFGMRPDQAETALPVTTTSANDKITLTWTRRTATSDVAYTVTSSTSLSSSVWTPVPGLTPQALTSSGLPTGYEKVSVTIDKPAGGQMFYRVEANVTVAE